MTFDKRTGLEIERKYIIRMPSPSILESQPEYTKSEILQIYLTSDEGVTHRIRRRIFADKVVYTETEKRRVNRISSEETEREISDEHFAYLSKRIKPGTTKLHKTRHTFLYLGQIFEIDVYPEWKKTAIMETELKNYDTKVEIPDFLTILKEVSGDKNYSNASMSHCFPQEYE